MPDSKILIFGGLGVIGRILARRLNDTHDITIADTQERVLLAGEGIVVDIRDYDQVLSACKDGYDAVINLTGLPRQSPVVEPGLFQDMLQTYVTGMYNTLLATRKRGIPKVIFASSNHVTGHYENEGISSMGRPIQSTDYPAPDDIHGVMKLFGEQAGKIFSNSNLHVLCLRLGTVLETEDSGFGRYKRIMRTLLSHEDLCHLFECALTADIEYGIYYGVSDNPGRPWSIAEAMNQLDYRPVRNSRDVLG